MTFIYWNLLKLQELDGRQLRVNYGPPPRKKAFIKEPRDNERIDNNYTTNTVYVGNLSWSVDNEALETLFWEHGNVMQAKVYYDKVSGRSRGFGFVTYSSPVRSIVQLNHLMAL